MPNYNPIPYHGLQKYVRGLDLNSDDYMEMMLFLGSEFEAFEPDPAYNFTRPAPSKDAWPVVTAKTAPVIGDLPAVMKKMMAITWKYADVVDNKRMKPVPTIGSPGHVFIGTQRPNASIGQTALQTYHPQKKPNPPGLNTLCANDDPLATDWDYFNKITRVNAVGFRGDTRSPLAVIKTARGFFPPNTRTDRYYLAEKIHLGFDSYLKRRYKRNVSKEDFLRAIDSAAPTDDDKKMLSDYLYWRKLMDREASHLARMTDHELLKGYISTARSLDTSIDFGTLFGKTPGWLYLTVVHGGFLVPFKSKPKIVWATAEGEIAQYGPIPADRIVGFRRLDKPSVLQAYQPVGPIFIRPSFRSSEPEAFKKMFKYMSGKTP